MNRQVFHTHGLRFGVSEIPRVYRAHVSISRMSDKTVWVIIFSRDITKDELVDLLLLVTTVVGLDIALSGILIFRR
jgi:hypothetical protein